MPLDGLAAAGAGGLDDFRVGAAREIVALLRQLADANTFVHLNGAGGRVLTTTLWAVDPVRGSMSFAADADEPDTQSLIEGDEAVVVAYLDSVKLQFDVHGLVLVRGPRGSTIGAALPPVIYRFQRRHAYRVRPLLRSVPLARVCHPTVAGAPLALRVIDVSIGGCALFLPDDAPALRPGVQLEGVAIELDADTRLIADLRLQHVTAINPDAHGTRLGCEFVQPSGDMLRALQRFIDQTQKRRRMMALD